MPDGTDTGTGNGLSDAVAQQRLRDGGYNALPSARARPVLAIAWTIVREPMFLLLVACGSIYLLLGERDDAAILLGAVLIIMSMSFVQERKSERAIEALRDLSSPRALVLREGRQQRIAGRDVVCGDILLLFEGDRIPADAQLFAGQGLSVDESLLSGESVAVRKVPCAELAAQMGQPGGDDQPFLYSGTLVVQGSGRACVLATGSATALGHIGQALLMPDNERSQLQRETAQAVRLVAIFSLGLVLLLTSWYGLSRGDWLNGILAGLTLAMALLPAELPLILTIFLGLGAWRIARQQVLTRRISAIEMLGATTVLCVDKTGTLTQNRMAVQQVIVAEAIHVVGGAAPAAPASVPEAFHATLEVALLASHRTPFDPMEKAIRKVGLAALDGTEHLHESWTLIDEYPLSPALLAMSRVWQSPDCAQYVIAAKGAPEAIIDLCHVWRQRCASLESRAHRHCDGRTRHRCGARSSGAGAAG
jgi:Ca2+-transporting ATPase